MSAHVLLILLNEFLSKDFVSSFVHSCVENLCGLSLVLSCVETLCFGKFYV